MHVQPSWKRKNGTVESQTTEYFQENFNQNYEAYLTLNHPKQSFHDSQEWIPFSNPQKIDSLVEIASEYML